MEIQNSVLQFLPRCVYIKRKIADTEEIGCSLQKHELKRKCEEVQPEKSVVDDICRREPENRKKKKPKRNDEDEYEGRDVFHRELENQKKKKKKSKRKNENDKNEANDICHSEPQNRKETSKSKKIDEASEGGSDICQNDQADKKKKSKRKEKNEESEVSDVTYSKPGNKKKSKRKGRKEWANRLLLEELIAEFFRRRCYEKSLSAFIAETQREFSDHSQEITLEEIFHHHLSNRFNYSTRQHQNQGSTIKSIPTNSFEAAQHKKKKKELTKDRASTNYSKGSMDVCFCQDDQKQNQESTKKSDSFSFSKKQKDAALSQDKKEKKKEKKKNQESTKKSDSFIFFKKQKDAALSLYKKEKKKKEEKESGS